MISNEYIDLVEKLLVRTKEGEVNWKNTVKSDEYMIYFKSFSLSISTSYDNFSNEHTVLISLRNDTGKEIDNFLINEEDPHYKMVTELHTGARRKALRIDEALSTIMTELESSDTVGLPEQHDGFDDDIPF